MDPSLKKLMEELKRKVDCNHSSDELSETEKSIRELKTEIFIKRNQVNQLRAELDATNLKQHELSRALGSAKKRADENQFNFNLAMKKSHSVEEELQDKKESLLKIELQNKLMEGEIEILKEDGHKMGMEKLELSRKVETLEAKLQYESAYHNEIVKKDTQMNNFIRELHDMLVKLQQEHTEAMELGKQSKLAKESVEMCQFLAKENEKLKKERDNFESKFIKVNAKCEKLEELVKNDLSINETNLFTKVVFSQWKKRQVHYQEELELKNENLSTLTASFNKEKSANIKLIKGNEELTSEISKLKQQITELGLHPKRPVSNEVHEQIDVKMEPIQID